MAHRFPDLSKTQQQPQFEAVQVPGSKALRYLVHTGSMEDGLVDVIADRVADRVVAKLKQVLDVGRDVGAVADGNAADKPPLT